MFPKHILSLKRCQLLPMLPTFYLTPTDHRLKIDFTPLLTKVHTCLLYRPRTRVFLRQSMWYHHLLQTLLEGGNQEQMTTNSSPCHQLCCRTCSGGYVPGLQRLGSTATAGLLGLWLGLHPSTTCVLMSMKCLRSCMKATLYSRTTRWQTLWQLSIGHC